MDIMARVLDEMHHRGAYLADDYTPHYVISYAVHAYNLMNHRKKVYWESANIPNQRLHLLFVAPPGFMKTYYLKNMGMEDFSIFKNTRITVGTEQSMSEAGFIGSIQVINGNTISTTGAADTYRDGVLLIDEFAAITNAFKSNYNNQMDSQFLAALDHGHVRKRLASGLIEYETALTLWAGVQPVKFDLESGLGRRFWYLLFLPTRSDNARLMRAMQDAENVRGDVNRMTKVWDIIDTWTTDFDRIERVEFSHDNADVMDTMGAFSYETNLLKVYSLGYYLATYGAEKKITVEMKDPGLLELLKTQISSRRQIVRGADIMQMRKMIIDSARVVDDTYVITKPSLIDSCIMIGWNAKQVVEKISEMQQSGMIKTKRNEVFMEMDV